MAPSSVVIKVKYGNTLRRFSAAVNEDQRLDLDLERLRTKICSFFNFRPDEGFVLTYIDEDDDQVTLADDEDLHDVMKQGLNPIRITVHLNVDKGAQSSARSAGSPTLDRSSSQNAVPGKKPGAGEILKSVPEPIIDALSKLSHEVASKAATASPVVADLINDLSKVGQSYLNASRSSSGSTTENSHEGGNDNQNSAAREKQGASANEGKRPNGTQGSTLEQTVPMSSSVSVPPDVKGERPAEPVRHPKHHLCFRKKGRSTNSGYIHYMPAGDGIKENDFAEKCLADVGFIWRSKKKDKEIERDSAGRSGGPLNGSVQTQLEKQHSSKKETDEFNPSENKRSQRGEGSNKSAWNPNFMGECPFSGSPFQPPYMQLPNLPFRRSFNNSADGMGSIFHQGVRCDGCGVIPITGPRFKSKVKHDYDLCSICFSRTGNEADYARIDFPLPYRHPWTLKGFYDTMFNHLPSIQASPLLRPHAAKQLHFRLDSRFIMDVNIMDGTLMAPSTPFTKIWRMRNNGTRPWVRGLQLLWIGGDRFSATDSVGIEIPVEGVSTGNEIDIAVDFIAPELPGRYVSYWRMAEPNGHKFGQRVWVLIQVEAAVKDSTNESSPVLNSDLPPGNASSSTCEDSSVVDLNLPPGNAWSSAHDSSSVLNLNLDVNAEPTGGFDGSGDVASAVEGITPSMIKQKGNTETVDINFPINDDLLVPGRGSSQLIHLPLPFPFPEFSANSQHKPSSDTAPSFMAASSSTLSSYSPEKQSFPKSSQVSYPVVDASAEQKPASVSSSVSYPIINMSEEPPLIPSNGTKDDDNKKNEQVRGENDVEETLLKELEEMGFKQVDLNKEVLRKNEYDLERSVDDLCDVSGWWDPILEDLQEMGFQDKATNKQLLVKNNGSIIRVVMDLIAGEKA